MFETMSIKFFVASSIKAVQKLHEVSEDKKSHRNGLPIWDREREKQTKEGHEISNCLRNIQDLKNKPTCLLFDEEEEDDGASSISSSRNSSSSFWSRHSRNSSRSCWMIDWSKKILWPSWLSHSSSFFRRSVNSSSKRFRLDPWWCWLPSSNASKDAALRLLPLDKDENCGGIGGKVSGVGSSWSLSSFVVKLSSSLLASGSVSNPEPPHCEKN